MSEFENRLTRDFILNEGSAGSSSNIDVHIQSLLDILGTISPRTATDRRRLAAALDATAKIRSASRRLENQVNELLAEAGEEG